ncbi:MAG: pilus assembly protein TadG-related protein [Mycobacteriales bacterium]
MPSIPPWRLHGDDGSMLPLILGCVLIVVVMIMGFTAATSAFLAQRDLESICDGAAEWAAGAVNTDAVSTAERAPDVLPISAESAQAAVTEYQNRFYAHEASLHMRVTSNGGTLKVACEQTVKIAFGGFFGYRNGSRRTTDSSINSPIT